MLVKQHSLNVSNVRISVDSYQKKGTASKSQIESWQFSCTDAESIAVRSAKLLAVRYLKGPVWPD